MQTLGTVCVSHRLYPAKKEVSCHAIKIFFSSPEFKALVFSRELLKAQAIGVPIGRVTKNSSREK